jgi:GT2 family glycosyltransferase
VRSPDGSIRSVQFDANEAVSENYPFFDWSLQARSPAWTSATAVLHTAFDAAGGFDETMTLGEDIHLWIRLIEQGRYALLHRPLAIYDRGDPASLSRTLNARGVQSRLRLIDFLKQRNGRVPARYLHAICEIHFCDLLNARAYRQAARFFLAEWSLPRGAALRHVARRMLRGSGADRASGVPPSGAQARTRSDP